MEMKRRWMNGWGWMGTDGRMFERNDTYVPFCKHNWSVKLLFFFLSDLSLKTFFFLGTG